MIIDKFLKMIILKAQTLPVNIIYYNKQDICYKLKDIYVVHWFKKSSGFFLFLFFFFLIEGKETIVCSLVIEKSYKRL